jgi:hypothetical protein
MRVAATAPGLVSRPTLLFLSLVGLLMILQLALRMKRFAALGTLELVFASCLFLHRHFTSLWPTLHGFCQKFVKGHTSPGNQEENRKAAV